MARSNKSSRRVGYLLSIALASAGTIDASAIEDQNRQKPATAATATRSSPAPAAAALATETKRALALRFHASKNSDFEAAAAAAREYLSNAPREPKDAGEMRLWLAAYDRVSARPAQADGTVDALPLEQAKRSLRQALLNYRAEYKITEVNILPRNVVPVSSRHETFLQEYSKVDFEDGCRLNASGSRTTSQILLDEDGRRQPPDKLAGDWSTIWDLEKLDPATLTIQSGSQLEARPPSGGLAYFVLKQGGKWARVPTPEYFVITAKRRANAGPAFDLGELVFTDESLTRNVAYALVRIIALCEQRQNITLIAAHAKPRITATIPAKSLVETSVGKTARAVMRAPRGKAGDRWVYAVRGTGFDGKPFNSEKVWTILDANEREIKAREESKIEQWRFSSLITLTPEWNEVARVEEKEKDPNPGGRFTYSPFKADFVYPLQPGRRWQQKSAVNYQSPTLTSAGSVETTAEILGWEQVSVPAGNFSALKIQYQSHSLTTFGSKTTENTVSSIRWYAPEINGFVREEHSSSIPGNQPTTSIVELVQFTPGP